jgi:transposase-like protein/IS1 family transposase
MKSLSCPNRHCSPLAKRDFRAIVRHGFYKTRWGKRRRYQCQTCGKTFCLTSGTPYYRLQHRRATFDGVAALSVEGLNKSAITRVKRISWNTVHRWLEKASACCRRFNSRKIKNLSGTELQADEIRTIVGSKQQSIWVFVVIDVWSRLWPSIIVGKRSYRDTLNLFGDLSKRMSLETIPLITTDGFKFYETVIGRVFGPGCVYGQVIKTRRNDRVVKVERRSVIGAGTSPAEFGGLSKAEHFVCRTAESDDPTGLGLSGSPNDLSGSAEAMSGRSHRTVSLLLQLHSAS